MFRVQARTTDDIASAVYKLVGENLSIMDEEKIPPIDPLESPVRYKRETPGANEFLNMRDIQARGYGDCEDLAAWLIAYFLFLGFVARPVLKQTGPRLLHVLLEVYFDKQWVEIDPSKLKGM